MSTLPFIKAELTKDDVAAAQYFKGCWLAEAHDGRPAKTLRIIGFAGAWRHNAKRFVGRYNLAEAAPPDDAKFVKVSDLPGLAPKPAAETKATAQATTPKSTTKGPPK